MIALRELRAHLPDEVVVVDIGCRWGFAPHWEALGSDVTLIGFDADETEVERLGEAFAGRSQMRFFARTLGSRPGQATLVRTREASNTSLFRRDAERLVHLPDYDGARITGGAQVAVTTLDDWIEEEGEARIDSLKLDTQGSELDILRGGTRALASARHVEVEVAFNELFEGAPLFGEVDAFLRGHGFALWRFRDLVHHALREAPDPSPVTEYVWYESMPQPLSSRGGQLMWCNAHFVRRDLYAPTHHLGWRTRLRDTCLMSALEFHDLALVALARLGAEPDCPDVVRLSAERALENALAEGATDRPAAGTRHAKLAGRVRGLRDRLLGLSDEKAD